MGIYVTLGADERGRVYGLELGKDGKWERNPLGLSTSCAVIRPVSRETYEYMTEDPESVRELWKMSVEDDRTELGLEEWFKEHISNDDLFDLSFVSALLDDEDNPTVRRHNLSIAERMDEDDGGDCVVSADGIWDEYGQPMSFRSRVGLALVESEDVASVDDADDDICCWESAGWFPPRRPFVVEFAPKELLEEYYAHLRRTCKHFKV